MIKLATPKQPGVQDLWTSVQCSKLPAFIIGCVSRHPKATASSSEYVQDVLKQMSVCKKWLYMFM